VVDNTRSESLIRASLPCRFAGPVSDNLPRRTLPQHFTVWRPTGLAALADAAGLLVVITQIGKKITGPFSFAVDSIFRAILLLWAFTRDSFQIRLQL